MIVCFMVVCLECQVDAESKGFVPRIGVRISAVGSRLLRIDKIAVQFRKVEQIFTAEIDAAFRKSYF